MTGTLLNVATVLVGTLIGTLVGDRLPERLRRRVLDGLGLVTLVIGVDLALSWRETSPLYVLGGVLLGGIVGEAIDIEAWLARLGDRLTFRHQDCGRQSECHIQNFIKSWQILHHFHIDGATLFGL